MDFQQAQYAIDLLVKRIRTGRLALPDFQRDFVWSPSQVVELLDSVAREWPIGSLLLLSGPTQFAFRPIDDGPRIDSDHLDLYILDGQQRVTALYHAIANVSPFCYYVDFSALLADEEDCIKWERRGRFEKEYPTRAARASAQKALIQDVWETETFYEWLQHCPSSVDRAQVLRVRQQRLMGLQTSVYKIMAIVLDQSIELEALARIFETLNRTGVALNAFDLMVAAMYPTGFRLRDEWELAKDRYQDLRTYEVNELELLRLIALLVRIEQGRGASRGVRQGDLLSLKRSFVTEYWERAAACYADALSFVRTEFGVVSPEVVPAWTMILSVASALYVNLEVRDIHAWWQTSLLRQSYAQAANTRVVSDVDSMFRDARIGLDSLPVPPPAFYLDKPARSNGLITRGMAALIVRAGGVDPLTGESLRTYERLALRAWDAERQTLRRLGADDEIASVVVLSAESDRHLGRAPSSWRLERLKSTLTSQGIGPEAGRRSSSFMNTIFG